jgi:two-component system response regulator RegX3
MGAAHPVLSSGVDPQPSKGDIAVPSPARLLVVDDEDAILEFVGYNLRKEGYEVVTAKDGDEALALAGDSRFDLVILDIMLPGTDGFEVCRRLRATSDMPVLFLSARDTELDKVVGLELGADDYLAKPFGIRELQARVKALLRRATSTAKHPSTPSGERFEAAGIALDEATHEVVHGGSPVDLTPREFELLACLMRHKGRVLSRDQLLRQAWGWEIVVETKTVDTHIKRLRDKLDAAGVDPGIVETVRGYGYRLNG